MIRPCVGPSTAIVILQNGIAVEQEYSELFPENPLLSGVVYLAATQTAPAVVAHKEVELTFVGTFPANAPDAHKSSAREFAAIITAGGGHVEVHEDVQEARWSKLLVNAAWNPICSITRSRDVQFLQSSPEAQNLVRNVMLEVASIAQVVGYPKINANKVESQINRVAARHLPGVEPSMLADVLAGKEMEVEAIMGDTIRIAQDYGVKTPLLDGLYALAKALNAALARERARKD